MQLVVGRIGRAHGVQGEATVEVRTGDPDQRFAIGATLTIENNRVLTITNSRWHNQILLREIIQLPGQDLLAIDTPNGEVLIPMVKQIIISIDITAKLIVVNPPEGLLDVKN